MMARTGVFVDEIAESLDGLGLGPQAQFFRDMNVDNPADLRNFWTYMDIADDQSALDVMSKFYGATQVAMIKPTLAASLTRNFAHYTEGLSREQALKLGYKEIADDPGLGKFLSMNRTDGKANLFPPEVVSQMRQMNEYLDYNRSFGGLQSTINKIDQITSAMKSSITLWRPGHHMVSFVGNTFFNVIAGVGGFFARERPNSGQSARNGAQRETHEGGQKDASSTCQALCHAL